MPLSGKSMFTRRSSAARRLLVVVGAAVATCVIGIPQAAMAQSNHPAAGTGLNSRAQQLSVDWSVADRPNGVVYRYGLKPGGLSDRNAASGGSSTAPCGQAEPPCDPPLVFTPNHEVMGGSTAKPGHATITPIFWAPASYSFSASYKSIIDGYLSNVAAASGTPGNVFAVDTQYYQQLNGGAIQHIQYSVTAGAEIDVSDAFPAQGGPLGCTADSSSGYTACVTDGALRTELQNVPGLTADDAHLYMVFFPPNVDTCTAPDNTSGQACSDTAFCAYHSAFPLNSNTSTPVIYANMPYAVPGTRQDPACGDPYNGPQAPNGNSYADTEISAISHEANEAITDWDGAWIDANGYEEADECAYVYGNPLGSTNVTKDGVASGTLYNQVINGAHYYSQDEFSNSDYAVGQGDAASPNVNTGGDIQVAGCIERPTAAANFTLFPGGATDIGTGANGAVWVIGTNEVGGGNYGIYRWTGSSWAGVPGGAVTIAVGPNGNPWVLNSTHHIYQWSGSGWALRPGYATDIAVGGDGEAWIIGTNPLGGGNYGIYLWNGSTWLQAPGGAVRIAAGPDATPWVINASHHIYEGEVNATTFIWAGRPGGATDIAVGADAAVFVIGVNPVGGGNYGIFHWNGQTWVAVPGGAVTVAVGPDGNPWVVNSAHHIYS